MFSTEEAKSIKRNFDEAIGEEAASHKVIAAAKAIRDLYNSLPENEQAELVAWVRLRSDLDSFVSGEDENYYIQIAVPMKGLRRANFEHLARYSSEPTESIAGVSEDDDEYSFNIWRSEWPYVERFLKQYEIAHRIVSGSEKRVSSEANPEQLF